MNNPLQQDAEASRKHARPESPVTVTSSPKRARIQWDPILVNAFRRKLSESQMDPRQIDDTVGMLDELPPGSETKAVEDMFSQKGFHRVVSVFADTVKELDAADAVKNLQSQLHRARQAKQEWAAALEIMTDEDRAKLCNVSYVYVATMEALKDQLGKHQLMDYYDPLIDCLKSYSWFKMTTKQISGENTSEIEAFIRNASLNVNTLAHVPEVNEIRFPQSLFVRPCYAELYAEIMSLANVRQVAVIGDPGVGKTGMSVYVLFRLVHQCLARRERFKVVHVSQGGLALIVESTSPLEAGNFRVYYKYDVSRLDWSEKATWLLLDGHAREEPFADKRTRGIVFASPKQKNYHEFVKSHGQIFFMPPWDWDEVKQYLELVKDIQEQFRYIGMARKKDGNDSADPSVAGSSKATQKLDDIRIQEDNDEEMDEGTDDSLLETFRVDDEAALSVRQLLERRFELVGGRIRLLLSDVNSLRALRQMVQRGIDQLSPEKIFALDTLDIGGYEPSVAYFIVPEHISGELPFTEYNIKFCSVVAARHAVKVVERHLSHQQHMNFRALRGMKGGSISGQIFENQIHEFIRNLVNRRGNAEATIRRLSRTKVVPKARKLRIESTPDVDPDQEFKFPPIGDAILRICGYDELSLISKSHSTGTYLSPWIAELPDVDCIVYPNVFIQVTLNPSHPYCQSHVLKLRQNILEKLKRKEEEHAKLHFIYVVPQDLFDSYKYQLPSTQKGDVLPSNSPEIVQYVMAFEDHILMPKIRNILA